MQKPTLVAIDTNFPLLLAAGSHIALDALEVVRQRMGAVEILVPPTVQGELLYQAENGPHQIQRSLAKQALLLMHSWHFHPSDLNSAEEAVSREAARKILFAGLLPAAEINDAILIAESALLNAVLLVSNDSHLLEIDHRRLGFLFRELDLPVPIIVSPRELVQKFYPK